MIDVENWILEGPWTKSEVMHKDWLWNYRGDDRAYCFQGHLQNQRED